MRINWTARRFQPFRLTALIDVIFLLLLFFMLSSNFLRYAEIQVAGASAAAPGGLPTVILRIEDGGQVVVNGSRIAAGELAAAIDRIDPPLGTTAMVSSRGGSAQELVAVSEILRAAGLAILLLHR